MIASGGAIERWSCTAAGELVQDEGDGPPPAYAHATATLRRPTIERQ